MKAVPSSLIESGVDPIEWLGWLLSAICLPAKQNNRKTNKKCGALLLALRLASVKMAANLAGGSKGGKMMAVSWGGGARLGG